MKRLLVAMISIMMIVTMMPTMAFATTSTVVADDDALIAALEKGESVTLSQNIKIDPITLSNAYGATGINVKNGQTIDGGGHTLDITGAGGTWDSGISTTGGTIKNITVTGSFRGIFVNHNSTNSSPVILDNVTIDGTVYTISCDQGKNQTLKATNSTFNGWTSYAATIGSVSFDRCSFGEGNGYAYIRPYAPTTFTSCVFEEGFEMDATRTTITLTNCYSGDTLITQENITKLLGDGAANADVTKIEVEDVPTVDGSKPVEDVEVGTEEATKEVLSETTEAIMSAIAKGEEVTNVAESVVAAVTESINKGDSVELVTSVTAEVVDKNAIDNVNALLIEQMAGEDKIAQYLELGVVMKVLVDGKKVAEGEVEELTEEVTFTIAIPEELKDAKDGYTRKFYVIRVHKGQAEKLKVTVNADGTLSFKTDRFSTYALAYEDTAKTPGGENNNGTTSGNTGSNTTASDKAVNTGDDFNMIPYIAVMAIALAGVAVAMFRRRTAK